MTSSEASATPRPGGIATRVEALGYRSLRSVAQDLSPFEVLVGPNASSKSTFLDVLAFLGDVVRVGVQGAIEGDARYAIPHRAADGKDLTWMRAGHRVELAAEFSIPSERLAALRNGADKLCRYELAIDVTNQLQIVGETLWLKPRAANPTLPSQRHLFPQPAAVPDTIVRPPRKHTPTGWKKVLSRGEDPSQVQFAAETSGWTNPFRISPGKAALASLPEDEEVPRRDLVPPDDRERRSAPRSLQRRHAATLPAWSHARLPTGWLQPPAGSARVAREAPRTLR